jgi:periplasmic divalent cation tolerance protein
MHDDDPPILLMVTAGGRNDAERLGEGLVVEHLAASCSVVPTVHSFYFAEDLLKREHESLLLIRTLSSKREAVMEYLNEHHSGERPEILEVKIAGGSVPYLEWLAGQVAKPGMNH